MRVLIQRVKRASVEIDGRVNSQVSNGLLVFVGITNSDTLDDALWLAKKVSNLRIFDDDDGVMNLSVKEVKGEILIVSQFTLHAKTKKGNRPSYINAAKPDVAIFIYEKFIEFIESTTLTTPKTGEFGAQMEVSLLNDGPVTIFIDSDNKE
ncbi:D-aminoacyl-tRNA deacylase [Marinilabiliaceae bacterium ANBcel2]|nr:D-aminoacyl-tRNA deacylase [Marinilabiliaceae bacterium ANBcel2]